MLTFTVELNLGFRAHIACLVVFFQAASEGEDLGLEAQYSRRFGTLVQGFQECKRLWFYILI